MGAHGDLRASALLALTKLMAIEPTTCDANLRLLFTLLQNRCAQTFASRRSENLCCFVSAWRQARGFDTAGPPKPPAGHDSSGGLACKELDLPAMAGHVTDSQGSTSRQPAVMPHFLPGPPPAALRQHP